MEGTWQEMLSALMDDELNEEETAQLLALICENQEAMATWKRWHVIKASIEEMPEQQGATQEARRLLLSKLSQRKATDFSAGQDSSDAHATTQKHQTKKDKVQ